MLEHAQSATTWACSSIDGFPNLDNLAELTARKDIVFRGVVSEARGAGSSAKIRVLEAFKGPVQIGQVIDYTPFSNCEQSFDQPAEERIFFGWQWQSGYQFSEGDGSIARAHPAYGRVLEQLRASQQR